MLRLRSKGTRRSQVIHHSRDTLRKAIAPPPPGFQQPYGQMQAPVVVKKSGVPVFVWVLGGILVFIIACSAIAYFTIFATINSAGNALKDVGSTLGVVATTNAFDLAMSTGDYETAHSYLGQPCHPLLHSSIAAKVGSTGRHRLCK